MRFSDKLPVLRKANNYSQEILAEKIGVSRQAVSKWESGESYPDMERILELCKVLNCSLEEIMDDGVVGSSGENGKRFTFLDSFNDFLAFITKTYNMFCAMKFKQKLKCFIEMIFIAGALFGLGWAVFGIAAVVFRIVADVPYIGRTVYGIVKWLLGVSVTIMGFSIWFHLFKIRYLDYFITVEDQNVSEKTIEEPFDKPFDKPQGDRIIIRDAKHSTGRFLDVFGKILLVIFKIFVVFFAIPFIGLLLCAAFGIGGSLLYLKYGSVFACSLLAFLGLGVILYAVLECLFQFVISKKQATKRLFIMAISGIAAIGLGCGLGLASISTYEIAESTPQTLMETIQISDNTILDGWLFDKYIIDNSVQDAQIEITYGEYVEVSLDTIVNGRADGFERYYLNHNLSFQNGQRLLFDSLKNKKIPSLEEQTIKSAKITLSQENYDKIMANIKKAEEIERLESYDAILGVGDVTLDIVAIYPESGTFSLTNNTDHRIRYNTDFTIKDEFGREVMYIGEVGDDDLSAGETIRFSTEFVGIESGAYQLGGYIHNIPAFVSFVIE